MLDKILNQFNSPNIQAISGLDATFLYGETPTSPMHVGSVVVIEGSLKFETFRQIILSRIHQIPKMRQRLVSVPLSMDYPYWVDDPEFDIDMHLSHIALPQPGGWQELRDTASQIFSEHLDRSRPLWSFTFVEGLDSVSQVPKGSVAVISKIHHVAIDGVAGAGILSVLYDISPKLKEIPAPKPYNPAPLPNELALIAKSTVSFATNPLKFPKLITNTLSATLKAGVLSRVQRLDPPPSPFSAPSTPLNGIISSRRKWNASILSLERIKALKNIMGTTLNDVILAICAGALRRYLLEKKKLPKKSLVALVPVSTRTEAEANNAGNQISSMLLQLATHIEDPIERLEVIHENAMRGKAYQKALGAKTLANMAEAVPFGLANQAARLYSRFHLAENHKPVFNVLITNVPGPNFPLYINGHKVLSIMGMAPIIDGMGLIITIFSYNGLVTISPTSDVKTMPDLDTFSRYLRESANELEAAILKLEADKKEAAASKVTTESPVDFFQRLETYFKKHPSAKKGKIQIHVTGSMSDNWQIDFNVIPATISEGQAENPDLVMTIRNDHLKRIAEGDLEMETAIVQGRLKVEGDEELLKVLKMIHV
ncbi:MAG: wax ester/triacylglycerol synthase family O-acyltransferase [Chitinophagales bacterium]